MATVGNLINPEYYQKDNSNRRSGISLLMEDLVRRADEERALKMKMQYEKELAQQEQERINKQNEETIKMFRMQNLSQLDNSEDSSLSSDKSIYGKSALLAKNPDNRGVRIIKRKKPTEDSMMSVPSGGYGDIAGNEIAGTEPEVITPTKTVIPRQSDISFGMDVDSKGRMRIIPKTKDNDIEKYQLEAVKIGIDPTGLNKDQLFKVISEENVRQKEVDNARKLKEKPPTQGQETTALYASRLKQANDVFDNLEEYTKNLTPVVYDVNAGLPDFLNFMKSGDLQSYQQAQRNFLNAVLRRESGAVISPSEFSEGRRQYFPQPGDKPETLLQKKANRELVMNNFVKASGNAYVPYDASGNSAISNNQLMSTSNNMSNKIGRFIVEVE